ncbi:Aste57867_7905 [Aphanomyces stellatus]|uniref:Aste57867_7905 protein n=1 Tax=Aphanomyces stellatus TaxID=120398 RepID=A0A485KIZ6_9STRA|nr:hypothetical protein As57867_007875 [Aphanomyces stellatus]VFT84798.1 Aste57867_7905 [Aphanomyces stellatus]
MAKKTGRGKSWCPVSVDLLLEITQDILPLGKNGWETVEGRFNRLAESKQLPVRDGDALKRKFLLLKKHPKPTGNPDLPDEVLRAKRVQKEIDQSVSVLSLGDEEDGITPKMMTSPQHPHLSPRADDSEELGRTGMPPSELEALSAKVKRARQDDTSCGLLSYTAKKHRSIDKYIEGASEADSKASPDMVTLILYLDERAAKREESRMEPV